MMDAIMQTWHRGKSAYYVSGLVLAFVMGGVLVQPLKPSVVYQGISADSMPLASSPDTPCSFTRYWDKTIAVNGCDFTQRIYTGEGPQ